MWYTRTLGKHMSSFCPPWYMRNLGQRLSPFGPLNRLGPALTKEPLTVVYTYSM